MGLAIHHALVRSLPFICLYLLYVYRVWYIESNFAILTQCAVLAIIFFHTLSDDTSLIYKILVLFMMVVYLICIKVCEAILISDSEEVE